jgi:hypothetical protein
LLKLKEKFVEKKLTQANKLGTATIVNRHDPPTTVGCAPTCRPCGQPSTPLLLSHPFRALHIVSASAHARPPLPSRKCRTTSPPASRSATARRRRSPSGSSPTPPPARSATSPKATLLRPPPLVSDPYACNRAQSLTRAGTRGVGAQMCARCWGTTSCMRLPPRRPSRSTTRPTLCPSSYPTAAAT